jgi:hypothetical protein
MRRLLILVLIAAAAWFGWRQYGDLFTKGPQHEAVVENRSDREMTGVRLEVGGRSFVKESLPEGETATFAFRVTRDASFDLTWSWSGSGGEGSWSGGYVPRGPMAQRHLMTVDGDGSVIYRAENR